MNVAPVSMLQYAFLLETCSFNAGVRCGPGKLCMCVGSSAGRVFILSLWVLMVSYPQDLIQAQDIDAEADPEVQELLKQNQMPRVYLDCSSCDDGYSGRAYTIHLIGLDTFGGGGL